MGKFTAEFEKAYAKRQRELGRDLTQLESEIVEEELFKNWIDQGRFDELIRRIHSEYGVEGGVGECAILGYTLREQKDARHIHALFQGLITRRTRAFWEFWPKAQTGHIGSMLTAAQRMANAMESYLEYFISLKAIGLDDEAELLRAEMLAFQARERIKKNARAKAAGCANK